MKKENCGRCGLSSFCALKGQNGLEYCSLYQENVEVCDNCGFPIVDNKCLILGNKLICPTCRSKLNTCEFCASAVSCSFEQDSSPLPKVVVKTFRQGNAVMQRRIKNPDRIEITCKKGCPCWDGEECSREYTNWCEKYREKSL